MNVFLRPKSAPYSLRMLNLFGSAIIAYWPLWEASGTVANDISGHSYNGSYTGVTLGQPGIGDGRTCPSFDGINDLVNVYSAGLAGVFDGSEGSVLCWARVSPSSIWTDGLYHVFVRLGVDGNNYLLLYKSPTNNYISLDYRAGGTLKSASTTQFGGSTAWFHIAVTWSKSNDQYKAYANGAQIGSTLTGLGTWSSSLAAANSVLGSNSSSGEFPWSGWLAHAMVLNRVTTSTEIATAARV